MQCKEIMKTQVKSVQESTPAHVLAKLMRDENIGFVPVCDADGRAVGVVTDRDIVVRLAADNGALQTPASEVMTRSLVTCSADDKLQVAEGKMRDLQKSRILCVDEDGKPVGVISLSDLAQCDRAKRIGRLLRTLTLRESRV